MTDTYGTESNGEHGHDEILTSEHDAVREPPSDYEFADEHGASAAEEHTEEMVTAPDVKPAGRSPLLPIAAAIGVLLLGGAAWWQFGGSGSAPAPTMPPLSAPPAMPAMPEVMQKTDASPLVPANMAVPAPTAAPVVPVPTSLVSSEAAAQPAPPAPVPVTMNVLPMAPPPVVSPAPAAAAQTPDQRIQELNARVDALQKALDQANQQLSQVSNMVAASAGTASPSVKDLQGRIDKLEQEAAQAHGAAPTLAVPASTSTSGDSVTVAPPAPRHAEHHKTAHAATVAHKKETAKPASTPAPAWVLRSASPGQAWVAASATAHDLQHVQAGDTLDGIGKVTAIDQENGIWIVRGTKGRIQ
jgi:hypothetical protein